MTIILKIYNIHKLRWIVMLSLVILASFVSKAENLKRIMDLEGTWKFSVGDNPSWADVEYIDKAWDYVTVPRSWENDGFVNYDGYAWYRKEFIFNNEISEETLLLILGYIDDVDEVYLNGQLIGGMGVMPPKVMTAHRILRKYPLPRELLNASGKNVIAVRVFDEYHDGGIYAGPVGIFYDQDNDLLAHNLAGYWDFETQFMEDNTSGRYYNQLNGKIYVPGYWDNFGFAKFDGTATYSTRFKLPETIQNADLMVVLGYIEDIDKVYINNVRIGSVEDLKKGVDQDKKHNLILRGYKIPPDLLKKTEFNLLQVKVYDTGGLGGIYEGPIGLISKNNFELLQRKKEKSSYNFWDSFFKELFEWN